MDLKALKDFLDKSEIPKVKKKPKTFLGIAKQPHYENVLSNIYAFYFNVNEEHGFGDLFLKSFQELISATDLGKTKDIALSSDSVIETEYITLNNGRIDMVIYDDTNAIIIENKVNHTLDNDLQDYWVSVNGKSPDVNKIGVLLSIKKYSNIEIGHEQYVNITHAEFLQAVMKNSGNYLAQAKDKYIVFLKDLYQNTINLSNHMELEKLDFYYKYQSELNDAARLKFAVRDFIKEEIKHACDSIEEKFTFSAPKSGSFNEKRLRYFVSSECYDLMFTIFFDRLLTNERELAIVIEIKGKSIEKVKQINRESFSDKESQLILKGFYSNNNPVWAHFACKKYPVSEAEIKTLNEFIKSKIESDHLLDLFRKIKKYLDPKRVEELIK